MLPLSNYYEWKLLVFDKDLRRVVRWEERENRWNWVDRGPVDITVWWNGVELIQCLLMECKYLHCHCLTPYTNLQVNPNDLVTVIFVTHYYYNTPDQVLAIIGSGQYLGNWNPLLARQFNKTVSRYHNRLSLALFMPVNEKAEWKFVLLNKRYRRVIKWEDHGNRCLDTSFPDTAATRRRLTIGANWNEDAYKVTSNVKFVDEHCQCKPYRPSQPLCEQENSDSVSTRTQTKRSVHFSENPDEVLLFEQESTSPLSSESEIYMQEQTTYVTKFG